MKILITTLILLISTTLFSQNWTGNVDADWNNSANWSSWPLNGVNITINPANYTGNAVSPIISTNSVFTPNQITVANGALLTIQANLTTGDNVSVVNPNSSLLLQSGTVAIAPGNNGRLFVDLGANLTVDGGILNVDQRLIVGDDATCDINNGIVTAGQRFVLELGGQCNMMGGFLNVAQTLVIADGNATKSSLFFFISGSVTVGVELMLENVAGNYTPTFFMDGGTLFVDGDVNWFGVAPGTGTPKMDLFAGTAIINGNIVNLPGSTVNMYLQIGGIVQVDFSGALIENLSLADTILQLGGSTFNITNTNTINNNGAFIGTFSTINFNGTTTLQGTGIYDFHSINISTLNSLTHSAPTNINVKEDFINNGTFNQNSNTVSLTGTTAQSISGATSTTFYNLTVNNTSVQGITLNQPIIVNKALTLTNGIVTTSTTNSITLIDNATSTSGNASSFVNGPFKKIGNDAFVFPIGKNGLWRRLEISAPTNINSEFVAEYVDASFTSTTPVNTPLNAVSTIEHWTLDKFNTTDNTQVGIYWEDATSSGISNCAAVTLARWDGTAWFNENSTVTGLCTASNAGNVLSNTIATSSAVFTFGFLGITTNQNVTLCDGQSITVGTNTYSSTGVYTDTLTASSSIDSTVITNLTVLAPIITNNILSVCNGQSITVGTNTYNSTGIYTDVMTSALGCDSTIITNLSVLDTVDVSVSVNGITLTANNTNTSASYQWINCDGNILISGATNQTYVPTVSGSYAVIVFDSICSDTSVCNSIVIVGVSEQINSSANIRVFPNPGNSIFTIVRTTAETSTVIIYNVLGKKIMDEIWNSTQLTINTSQFSKGTYYYSIISEKGNQTNGIWLKN
jgi:hypothetical protein